MIPLQKIQKLTIMDHVICSYLGQLCSIVESLRSDLIEISSTLNDINDKLDNIETGATDILENIDDSVDMLSEKMNNICDSFGKRIGIDPEQTFEESDESEESEKTEDEGNEETDRNGNKFVADISINIGDIDTDDIDVGTDEGFIELARRIKNRFCK